MSSSSAGTPLQLQGMGLPEMVQSQILSSFCDGKSISTYFHILLTNHQLRPYAFNIIRDALVDRYKNLAAQCVNIGTGQIRSEDEEVRDVVDIIREDIRKCTTREMEDDDGTNNTRISIMATTGGTGGYQDDGYARNIVALVSEWCAIADYFELNTIKTLKSTIQQDHHHHHHHQQQQHQYSQSTSPDETTTEESNVVERREYVVWCGQLIKHGLMIERSILTTPYWTITALDYFHEELELNSSSYLTHPSASGILQPFETATSGGSGGSGGDGNASALYGSLHVLLHEDADAMHRIRYSMSDDPDSQRFYLVPNQMEWEPCMGFALNVDDPKSLSCEWNGEDGGDFDYSLSHFASNVIRILRRISGDTDDDDSDDDDYDD